jgi:hypothetical protein
MLNTSSAAQRVVAMRVGSVQFFYGESSRLPTTVAIIFEADRAFRAAQGGSAPRDTNQHFLTAVQCDLLTSVKSRGS